uniref:PPIase cyclophilin-type domain-containing protein n=1 Tax=Hemiselmis andersenii TaxID=464988 RepID=A0A6T8K2A2_HEMAN|mmetsp:Transcript_9556/g.23429  ORF Transcript_9556/g.23429 Transcript_9556/m.23429 type:complete len:166 (+) Transcript_9556:384-881(+)
MSGPTFVISTDLGDITVRLREDAAPQHASYMRNLIEAGKYNGAVFYRAEKGFVLQGGLQDASGAKRPAGLPNPPLEFRLPNKRGTVTMARWEDPNSGAGEFFINLGDSPHLDRTGDSGWGLGFTVFGEVVSGLEVADKASLLPTVERGGLKMLTQPIVMNKVAMQ